VLAPPPIDCDPILNQARNCAERGFLLIESSPWTLLGDRTLSVPELSHGDSCAELHRRLGSGIWTFFSFEVLRVRRVDLRGRCDAEQDLESVRERSPVLGGEVA
jgi:hypothetical protein